MRLRNFNHPNGDPMIIDSGEVAALTMYDSKTTHVHLKSGTMLAVDGGLARVTEVLRGLQEVPKKPWYKF